LFGTSSKVETKKTIEPKVEKRNKDDDDIDDIFGISSKKTEQPKKHNLKKKRAKKMI